MTSPALRMLQLQTEFVQRTDTDLWSSTDVANPPRSEEEIASDYAEALRDFLR